ncbi:MAG TPA: hypothetical protein VFU49_23360 [Ktedonobacteraceae bacterium]|nr:hypothetical protein [Ktedonobacteraceae bacterium]
MNIDAGVRPSIAGEGWGGTGVGRGGGGGGGGGIGVGVGFGVGVGVGVGEGVGVGVGVAVAVGVGVATFAATGAEPPQAARIQQTRMRLRMVMMTFGLCPRWPGADGGGAPEEERLKRTISILSDGKLS